MFPIVQCAADKMVEYIQAKIDSENGRNATIDAKQVSTQNDVSGRAPAIKSPWLQLISRYAAITIVDCLYRLECDGFVEKSEVHSLLMRNFNPSIKRNIINAVLATFPFIERFYQQSFFPPELTEWFYGIMTHAMELRSTGSPVQRNDLFTFLMELKQSLDYSEKTIAAFAATFFFDAYETTSMVLVQVLYQLAKNPRCQDELRAEIDNLKELTFSNVESLKYLDRVVNGTWNFEPPFCSNRLKWTRVSS